MPTTVFYSWQSDRDAKTTRYVIRDAIEEALKTINADIGLNESEPRDFEIDHDTKDVPGTPEIVKTILEKIDAAGIFVADLTYVATVEKRDGSMVGLSNPNVLTERGYALKTTGSTRMIAVLNEAYGPAKSLPFDFQHARHPITFNLPEGASGPDRKVAVKALSTKLTEAIRLVIEKGGIPVEEQPVFAERQPTTAASVFFTPGEALGPRGSDGKAPMMPDGPKLFLRLIPSRPTEEMTTLQVRGVPNLPNGSALMPLCIRAPQINIVTNAYGAATLGLGDDGTVLSLTQVLRTREIWGIDSILLRDDESRGKVRSLPSVAYEEELERALERYLTVARSNLGLQPPLRFIVGITDAAGIRLAVGQPFFDPFSDPLPLSEVVHEGQIMSWDEKPRDVLLPFYNRLWEEFGVRRPINWRLT